MCAHNHSPPNASYPLQDTCAELLRTTVGRAVNKPIAFKYGQPC